MARHAPACIEFVVHNDDTADRCVAEWKSTGFRNEEVSHEYYYSRALVQRKQMLRNWPIRFFLRLKFELVVTLNSNKPSQQEETGTSHPNAD